MLELPLRPLLHIAFVGGWCFIFVFRYHFVSVLVRWLGSSFAVFCLAECVWENSKCATKSVGVIT